MDYTACDTLHKIKRMRNKRVYKFLLILILAGLTICATKPPDEPPLPKYAYIRGVSGKPQSYSLSCESRSATDLLAFYGIRLHESLFVSSLPRSDNPEEGFVGDVTDDWGFTPPKSYGVHAQPIAELITKFGLEAEAHHNMTFRELKREIAEGRPVIVWVIGHVWKGSARTYTTKQGEQVLVAPFEHTMLAVGYTQKAVYLIDAGDAKLISPSIQDFKDSWAVLGNMAVTAHQSGPERPTSTPTSTPTPLPTPTATSVATEAAYIVKTGDNLTRIAWMYGLRWQDLAAWNHLTPPYELHTGQVLLLRNPRVPATP
jgi:uncharacterized protein YvpB